ncbi:MAG TPA: hypothetical protein VGG33_06095 [Polyangia bacterium]
MRGTRGRFFSRLLLIAFATLTAACTGPLCDLTACDIRQTSCQQQLARATACLLDQPPLDIPVTTITRSQLRASMVSEVERTDLVREQLRLQGLGFLNLANPAITPQEAARFQADFIGAFYDRRNKGITVVVEDGNQAGTQADRPLDGPYVPLLVHEFTHAIQDHLGRLDFPRADGDGSYDRFFARGALVEGEASLNESRAALALTNHDPYHVVWQPVLDRLQTEGATWVATSPVPVDFAYSGFVYPFGLEVMRDVFRDHRSLGLTDVWEHPPTTARQVQQWPAPQPSAEDLGADAIPVVARPNTLIETDRMGAFVFLNYLMRLPPRFADPFRAPPRPRRELMDLAEQLQGDQLSLFRLESPTGPLAFAVWRLRFATPEIALSVASFLSLPSSNPNERRFLSGRDVILLGSPGGLVSDITGWRLETFAPIAPASAPGRHAHAPALPYRPRTSAGSRLFCPRPGFLANEPAL